MIQVAESGDLPVMVSWTATAQDGSTSSATLGLSLDMLAARSFTGEIRKRPVSVGTGVAAHGTGEAPPLVEQGTVTMKLGPGRTVSGTATLGSNRGTATFSGSYELSCWVRPQVLGRRPNGRGPAGGVERLEDESFRSAFCKRVARLR